MQRSYRIKAEGNAKDAVDIDRNASESLVPLVYTAMQIARLLFTDVIISNFKKSEIIRAKGIYRSQPSSLHYRSVQAVLMDHMRNNRKM